MVLLDLVCTAILEFKLKISDCAWARTDEEKLTPNTLRMRSKKRVSPREEVVADLFTLVVAVPILHEFTPDQIHNIVNHSGAKLLFAGDVVSTQVDPTKMPDIEGIIYIPDYSLLFSRSDKLTFAREHLNEMFGKKFPKYFRAEHVNYYKEQSPDELALINYTSGTTGFSKGVMIPYRAIWSNYDFACHVMGNNVKKGDNVLSVLPMAWQAKSKLLQMAR